MNTAEKLAQASREYSADTQITMPEGERLDAVTKGFSAVTTTMISKAKKSDTVIRELSVDTNTLTRIINPLAPVTPICSEDIIITHRPALAI